ncbi:hypothetical protein C8J56DRAFT_1158630 [Mycena floridula]|nr:hypothetical protein C8J56DRAFT_1158630 [Mycena floridula]
MPPVSDLEVLDEAKQGCCTHLAELGKRLSRKQSNSNKSIPVWRVLESPFANVSTGRILVPLSTVLSERTTTKIQYTFSCLELLHGTIVAAKGSPRVLRTLRQALSGVIAWPRYFISVAEDKLWLIAMSTNDLNSLIWMVLHEVLMSPALGEQLVIRAVLKAVDMGPAQLAKFVIDHFRGIPPIDSVRPLWIILGLGERAKKIDKTHPFHMACLENEAIELFTRNIVSFIPIVQHPLDVDADKNLLIILTSSFLYIVSRIDSEDAVNWIHQSVKAGLLLAFVVFNPYFHPPYTKVAEKAYAPISELPELISKYPFYRPILRVIEDSMDSISSYSKTSHFLKRLRSGSSRSSTTWNAFEEIVVQCIFHLEHGKFAEPVLHGNPSVRLRAPFPTKVVST